MKIVLYRRETEEEFEKISDGILRDLVNRRGMPTDDGHYMRTTIDEVKRDDSTVEITLTVHRVKCSRPDDF